MIGVNIDGLLACTHAALKQRFAGIGAISAEDIADTISYVVTRNRRIALNEILMRPTPQDF